MVLWAYATTLSFYIYGVLINGTFILAEWGRPSVGFMEFLWFFSWATTVTAPLVPWFKSKVKEF